MTARAGRRATVALLIALAACSNAESPAPAPARLALRPSSTGRYLVRLDRPARALDTPLGAVQRRFAIVPALSLRADPAAAAALARHPYVRAVEPDEGGSGQLLEALALTATDQVREAGHDGSSVVIAVVDTGVDADHSDLAGAVIDEACFCSVGTGCCPGGGTTAAGPGSAEDDHGHGTHVATTIASRGVSGPLGGAPGVQLVAVKVLNASNAFCCMSDVIAALDWIAEHHPEVRVVNLSLGADALYDGDCDALNTVLGDAVDALRDQGTLVVAASGNDGSSSGMRAPACIAHALSTGAVWDADVGAQNVACSDPITAPDRIACFSNGSATTDLLAPGGVITSGWAGGAVTGRSGTSHAAPVVTACVAALLSARPEATPDGIEAALEAGGVPVLDSRNGLTYPRLDCAASLARLAPGPELDAGSEDDAGSAHDSGAPFDAGTAGHGGAAGAGSAGDTAGPLRDAAADAAITPDTGTVSDASAGPDAAQDASPLSPEAGTARDGGAVAAARGADGCSCRAAGAHRDGRGSAGAALALLFTFAALALRRAGAG